MKKSIVFFVMLVSYCCPAVAFADCNNAKELFEKAELSKDDSERINLYRESINLCPSYAAYYKMGITYMQMGKYHDAKGSLEEALKLNVTVSEVYFAIGDACMELKDYACAALNYQAGLSLKHVPGYEDKYKMARIGFMNNNGDAMSIKNVLSKGIQYRSRSIGVVPAIDVRVEFEFDSARLAETGKRQADEIGKAIKELIKENTKSIVPVPDEPNALSRQDKLVIKLIGHTDTRGSDEYNDRLSVNRANSVREYLMTYYQIPEDLLATDGKGEREPLIPDARTERDHAVNRRVEIHVISK